MFWTVEDLALHLRVPKTWVYDRTRENGPEVIPHIKLGKYVRFNPESEVFQKWLAGHEQGQLVGSRTQQGGEGVENKWHI